MNLPGLKTALPWHYNESSKPEFNTMTSLIRKKKNKNRTNQAKNTNKQKNKQMSQNKTTTKKSNKKNKERKKIPNDHTTIYNSYNNREFITNIFLAHWQHEKIGYKGMHFKSLFSPGTEKKKLFSLTVRGISASVSSSLPSCSWS